MAAITAQEALTRQAGVNRWDSPWLNVKTVSGLAMVLAVLLVGLVGPLFWDVTLARAASSPLNLGSIVGGATLVEYLFAYPGVGYLLYQGIVNNDFTLIQGIVFILILTTATAVLIVDLLYPLVDPRISYQGR